MHIFCEFPLCSYARDAHGVFVTFFFFANRFFFFTDQTVVSHMFLFLHTHMVVKLPIVFFFYLLQMSATLQLINATARVVFFSADGQAQHILDTVEPSTLVVLFADDTTVKYGSVTHIYDMAEEITMDNELYK